MSKSNPFKGLQSSPEIIRLAVMMYIRFPLSLRNLEDLLHREIFYSLREAQIIIEGWRRHYNTKRPHSALGYRPPAPETIVQMETRPTMH